MQAVFAVRGAVRRWSGLTTLVMLVAIVVLPKLARVMTTELAINGRRTVPVTHYMKPHAGWDYYGFMMNGGRPPSPRWPQFSNGGANLAAGLAATIGEAGRGDPALSWIQTGKGTGAAKVSVRAASASGATVTIEIPGIQTEPVAINGEQYTKLTIPGAVSTGFGVGKAEVPSIPVLLARPTGSAVTFSILSVQTETLHVERVFPVQPPLKSGEQAGPLVVDNSFYSSDAEYPPTRFSSPSLATWRDLDVVNVHVYPVVVRPAQHEIIVATRITFRASFSGGSYPKRVASWMQPMYQRLIRNYDNLRFSTSSIEPPGTKCLVFCYQNYVSNDSLDTLLHRMTMLGDETEIIQVGGSAGMDADEYDIKDTIIARYVQQDSVLRWVFLIGTNDEIPLREEYARPEWGGPTVRLSDYWYTDLDGRALLPGGQDFIDSCDNYPEVGIARLAPGAGSVGAQADLRNQVTKIWNYMMGGDSGGWLDTVTLVAHREDPHFPPVVRAVKSIDLDYYDYARDTIMGCDTGFDNGSITAAVNKGTGVLIYRGHGLADQWQGWYIDDTTQNWANEQVRLLGNQRTPVVFNIACHCGDLSQGTCLSEQWMSQYDESGGKGAVASFASTDTAWTFSGNSQCSLAVMAIGDTWSGVTHEGKRDTAPVFDLGGIKMLMDAYIATNWGNAGPGQSLNTQDIYSFMWLGNPAMQIWSGGTPQAADVTYPSWIPTGDARPFTVSVKIGNDNVEGAQVCVCNEDFYVVGTTDASGMVTFSLDAETEGLIQVAASKGHRAGQPPTPMLPYFGTSYAGGNGPRMTYPDWGRKLARDPNNGSLHVVYTGNDTVFYTQSTDDGATWPTVEPIGEGTSPAIVLNIVVGDPPTNIPWVVYLTPDGSIERAIRLAPGTWDKAIVFQGKLDSLAGAPSLAACPFVGPPGPEGYVAYPVSYGNTLLNNLVYFNTFSMYGVSQAETVDIAGPLDCYGASVVATPGSAINVSWIRDQSVFYSQRAYGIWSLPFQISSPSPSWPITEPASNPSMEAYGDSVFCVWSGPNDDSLYPHDIWRRSRWLSYPVSQWEDPTNQSGSPTLESDFPVMTTSFATVWHEEAPPGNFDIWGRFLGDLGPRPFFQTPSPSYYPHVDGYWVPNQWTFRCNTVWTEQASLGLPSCTLAFGACDWNPWLGKGLGPGPHEGYEPASYYAAEMGKPKQSPYCLSRGGFAQFESLSADTSATGLTYELPYLDPRRTYKLRAVLYHEGEGTWKADLRCDSGQWEHVKVDPHVPDTFWMQVPKRCYKSDARIVIELTRATGDYVSLAGLKLFQIEEETRGGGGVQSWGTGMTFVTRLRGCTPNPFARGTSVNYELANCGPVELTVHDVSGRLVRKLESGPRQRGFHAVRWDGADGSGHSLPAGVYFLRYSAGCAVSTGRLTLVR